MIWWKFSQISPLHGGRLTFQPPSRPTGPPSPPACHSSWSNRTAPSADRVSDLTNTQTQPHIRALLFCNTASLKSWKCVLGDQNGSTHRPPGRGWTSRCQSWRKVPAPCWQSRCKRGIWWPDRTDSPVRRPKIRWNATKHRNKRNKTRTTCWDLTSGRLCSLRCRLLVMKLVNHSFRSSTFFLLKACNKKPKKLLTLVLHQLRNEGTNKGRSYKGDSFVVLRSSVFEGNTVSLHVREVLLGLLGRAGSQTWMDEGNRRRKPIRYSMIMKHRTITRTLVWYGGMLTCHSYYHTGVYNKPL